MVKKKCGLGKGEGMKHALKSCFTWISVIVLAAFFLSGCASQTKSTQPEEKSAPPATTKEEPTKPEPKPAVKAEPKPEAKPESKPEPKAETKPARPAVQETNVPAPPVEIGKPSAAPAAPSKPAAAPAEPPKPAAAPAKPAAAPSEPAKSAPPAAAPAQAAQERTTEVALGQVNFRQGPTRNDKILRVLKKGTKLIILEDKEDWLRVRLDDGAEGWVAKSVTLEGAQPPPSAPPKGQK